MSEEADLLRLNGRLLDSIVGGDWAAYSDLCDPTLSAFEPEAMGQLVEGLSFHEFYFQLDRRRGPVQTTMCSPKVRLMGTTAVVTYVRLTQSVGGDGVPKTTAVEETRIWQQHGTAWKHVHFHRSMPTI